MDFRSIADPACSMVETLCGFPCSSDMRKIGLFFNLFLILTALGCNEGSSPSGNGAVQSYAIVGTWNWVQTAGGKGGIIENPALSGLQEQYTFNSESSFVLIEIEIHDSSNISDHGNYAIARMFYPITQDTQSFISFADPNTPFEFWQLLQYRASDTILIGDTTNDGTIATYARSK